jgi:Double zinc ribbon
MSSANVPWPCPICAELIDVGLQDCPHCGTPADWMDQMRALDFSIRQFHYWHLTGGLDKTEYRAIVDASRIRREGMTRQAEKGEPAPQIPSLPSRSNCWSCAKPIRPNVRFCGQCGATLDAGEVRLLRFNTFLRSEIAEHAKAGRIAEKKSLALVQEVDQTLASIRVRLEAAKPR